MKNLILAALLAVFLIPVAWAASEKEIEAQFEEGVAANKAGDYEAAMAAWLPLAEDGDPFAQFNIGIMYRQGNGVEQNDREAVRWYRAAAEQGHGNAQFNLAYMYATGKGVTKDNLQSHMWFSMAASSETPRAAITRDKVAKRLTPEELAESKRLVDERLERLERDKRKSRKK